MKRILLLSFLFLFSFIECRQYDIDYLFDLIDSGNKDGVIQFLSNPELVKKPKHIVEFVDLFQKKLSEKYDYTVSWRDAYNNFKPILSQTDLPKEQKKEVTAFFKEIVFLSETKTTSSCGYMKLNSFTVDYKGSMDPGIEIDDDLAIAYTEALAGGLLCIIPSGITQAIGLGLITHAATQSFEHLKSLSKKPNTYELDRDYSESYGSPKEQNDRDSWDKEW